MQSLYWTVEIRCEMLPCEGKLTIQAAMSKETAQKCAEMTRDIAVKYVPLGSPSISIHVVPSDPSYPFLSLMELEEEWIKWEKYDSMWALPPTKEGQSLPKECNPERSEGTLPVDTAQVPPKAPESGS